MELIAIVQSPRLMLSIIGIKSITHLTFIAIYIIFEKNRIELSNISHGVIMVSQPLELKLWIPNPFIPMNLHLHMIKAVNLDDKIVRDFHVT